MGNAESMPHQRRGSKGRRQAQRSRSMDHTRPMDGSPGTTGVSYSQRNYPTRTNVPINDSPLSTGKITDHKPMTEKRRKTPARAKSFESGVQSKRERGVSRSTRTGGRKNQRRSSKSNRHLNNSALLADQDLDEILAFVNEVKQTNLGGNMLEEFVVRQTEDIEATAMGGSAGSNRSRLNGMPPISSIQIEIK